MLRPCRRGKVRSNFRATDKLRPSYIAGRRTECKDVQLQCDSWYDTRLSLGLSHLGWQTTKFYQQMLTKGCKLILTGRNEMAWTQAESRTACLRVIKVRSHYANSLSFCGDRAFPVAAVRIRNSLPQHITSAPSLPVFCSRLKTYFF